MRGKKIISLITALCGCLMISATATAQTSSVNTLEVVTHDFVTGEDSISVFNSATESTFTSTTYTAANNFNLSNDNANISPNSIIDSDDRVVANPYQSPYSAVLCLEIGVDVNNDGITDGWTYGTGFLTGKNTMVTAAHCVFDSNSASWINDIIIHYYQNSYTLNLRTCRPQSAVISTQYAQYQDYNYDWAIVTLNEDIGNTVGYWFGYGTTEGSLAGKSINVSGYPVDKQFFQYVAPGTISRSDTYNCFYDADMLGCQSGGPVFDDNGIVWAINTYEGGSFNQGNRLTREVYDLISSYSKS